MPNDERDAASRQAITEVISRYGVYIDAGEFDALETLFAEDAVFDISPDPGVVPVPVHGRRNIRDTLEDRYKAVSPTAQRRHLMTNVVVDELTGDEARSRCFLTVLSVPKTGGAIELRGTGVYHDHLRRENGTWLIKERRLVLDALGG
jgi:3-phenylpropionate/cinnamic acid dioxygenase small subunit